MNVLANVTALFLVIVGGAFAAFGSNVQSRIFGLVAVSLGILNAVKLVGLI